MCMQPDPAKVHFSRNRNTLTVSSNLNTLRPATLNDQLEQLIPMNPTLSAMLTIVAVTTFGCGRSSTYESPDGAVTVSQKGEGAQLEIVTKDGKATMTAGDTGVAIPSTFPKDVPILKGAMPKMTMSQGKTELLHLQVPGSVADVAKEYQEKLKAEGWEIETMMNMGETSMVHAKKGGRKCAAMVMKDDAGTMVQLSVTEQ